MIKIKAILTIMLFIGVICSSPIIKAQQTETFTGILYIAQNPDFAYTHLTNLANASDRIYTNYNATLKPFLENNTDIKGRVITPLTFPHIYELNKTSDITMGQFFRLGAREILSGVSQFWIRIPIENLTDGATINARLYRSWVSGLTFNMSIGANGEPTFEQPGAIREIFNITEYLTPANRFYRDYIRTNNVTLLNTTLNFTYLKITAPIIPNDNYFLYFNITGITNRIRISYTACDFANDELYNSWVKTNNNDLNLEIDLDIPIITIYGMGSNIGGANCQIDDSNYYRNYWVHNKTIDRIITNGTEGFKYLNYVVPFTTTKELNITYGVFIYNNASVILSDAHTEHNTTGRSFICETVNISAKLPAYISHVSFYIWVNGSNATQLKLYMETQTDSKTDDINTINYFNNASPPHRWVSKYGMALFGYIEFEDFLWENTQIEKFIINETEPETPQEILRLYQKIVLGMYNDENELSLLEEFLAWYISENWIVRAAKSAWKFLKEKVIDPLSTLFNSFGKALISFGTFIWKVITGIVDAIVWLAYLTMKTFYAIIVLLIYFISISSVFLLCEAITVGLKAFPNGGLKQFQMEINNGWPKLYFMINTLFSVLLLLFVLINTVYNFIKVW